MRAEPAPEARVEYVYAWRNNARRAELYGRRCRLVATGRMGTVLVEFADTGERVTTSRRALRKTEPGTPSSDSPD
jgi:hypothetical protein